MRLPILMTGFLLVSLAPLAASEPSTDVVLTDDGGVQTFAGSLNAGAGRSFTYTAASTRQVVLTIAASSEDCGAEMKTSSQRGFMPDFARFPTTRTEQAQAGETFKVSFFQTRSARMSKVACAFSLSIQ
jgi:hypothetical protein